VTTADVTKVVDGVAAGVENEDLIVQETQFDGRPDGIWRGDTISRFCSLAVTSRFHNENFRSADASFGMRVVDTVNSSSRVARSLSPMTEPVPVLLERCSRAVGSEADGRVAMHDVVSDVKTETFGVTTVVWTEVTVAGTSDLGQTSATHKDAGTNSRRHSPDCRDR
jgi:hypothetical protein